MTLSAVAVVVVEVLGMLTLAVRRMFLDLPAQLGHIGPPSSTASVVQLGNVALGLLVLCAVLLKRKPGCGDDVAVKYLESWESVQGTYAHGER